MEAQQKTVSLLNFSEKVRIKMWINQCIREMSQDGNYTQGLQIKRIKLMEKAKYGLMMVEYT